MVLNIEGCFLRSKNATKNNWEGVLEKIQRKLRWVLPQLSFRGKTLIINNLVASQLWHRVACVQPLDTMITKIQRELIDFWGEETSTVSEKKYFFYQKRKGGMVSWT